MFPWVRPIGFVVLRTARPTTERLEYDLQVVFGALDRVMWGPLVYVTKNWLTAKPKT